MTSSYALVLAGYRVFGVPAHPLVVHAAVVLVPLAALAFVTLIWRERWRETYLLPIMLIALAGAIAAFVARETGESLEELARPTGESLGDHPEQGDLAFVFSALFGFGCAATYILYEFGYELRDRFGALERFRLPVPDEVVAYLVTLPLAFLAVLTLVLAGHSGAELVWKDFP
jgi:hypothetical protein